MEVGLVEESASMTVDETPAFLLDEIAILLASAPSQADLLKYKISEKFQNRARQRLAKLKSDALTKREEEELDHFVFVDALRGLAMARIHLARKLNQGITTTLP